VAAELRNLDAQRATVLESLCDTIVPGSAHVGPVVYIDAIMSEMPPPQREAVIESIDALAEPAAAGPEALRPHALTPAFQLIRALAIEAYYSDFMAPGATGPSAYEEIDFHSPLAMRIKKDWSYLGVTA
jgi:Gluconate 2-dehydrogenase subunit 3